MSRQLFQSNELLSSGWLICGLGERPLVCTFGLCTFGLGDRVCANVQLAFRSRHPEEIGEQVEMRCHRHSLELGGHLGDVARDVETLPRHNSMRRIVSSTQRPRGALSRISQVQRVSVLGNLLRRSYDKTVHSKETNRPPSILPQIGGRPSSTHALRPFGLAPRFLLLVTVHKTPISNRKTSGPRE